MKNQILLLASASLLVASSALMGCSGDDNNSTTTPPTDSGPGTDSAPNPGDDSGPAPGDDAGDSSNNNNPAPPALGTQIDRMGRPAVNTALNHAFDGTAAAGTAKDAYNADKTPTDWVTTNEAQFEANLAILDSLNIGASADGGGVCGDQPYADNTADSGAVYKTLADVMANDMLWLKTDATACTTGYLAVELNATNVVVNTDCGGRNLTYDTIQTTYSVVSGVGLTGFGSGVSAVAAKTNGTTFPYLATPL